MKIANKHKKTEISFQLQGEIILICSARSIPSWHKEAGPTDYPNTLSIFFNIMGSPLHSSRYHLVSAWATRWSSEQIVSSVHVTRDDDSSNNRGSAAVQSMGKAFKDDALFRSGLQTLMEDKTAKRIRKMNLHPARNFIFHFLPELFAEKIKIQPPSKCLFLKSRGKKKKDVYCTFADGIVKRTLVGDLPDMVGEFTTIAVATRELIIKFVNDAETLISFHLQRWGFAQHQGA